jgi:pyruvate/2-oxoglutarate dehydrogenase complex dihydrolipoamide acyltransferase (E2) component
VSAPEGLTPGAVEKLETAKGSVHRILYGADGAQFLARVRGLLEEPVGLAL